MMKRILFLLCALLLILLCACGTGTSQPQPGPTDTGTPSPSPVVTDPPEQTPEPSPEPTVEPSPEPLFFNPLTGLPTEEDNSGQRPIAIMLNNIRAAMPQQGNGQADIIYEIPAEGGITRMLGVYQDISQLGNVGSVRSARLYYYELAMGHDAVFVHAGGSQEFYDFTAARGLSTVDGVNGPFSYAGVNLFWRDRERIEGNYYAYEHSLLTSGERMTRILTERGILGPHREDYVNPLTFAQQAAPADGDLVKTVTVPFSGGKSTIFHYDQDSGQFLVEQYGAPYIDGNDGTQIAVTNLLVLQTKMVVVDDAGRLRVDLSSGSGWFACGGTIRPITWEKGGLNDPLRYYDEFGQPLTLGQGKSYVCIISLSREISVELVQP